MKVTDTVKSWFNIGIACGDNGEGCYNGAAVGTGELGNTFCEPVAMGFQRNLQMETSVNALNTPAVHACIMITANAVALCRPKHHKETGDQTEVLKDSVAAKVLRNPNHYQTWVQWITNAVIQMKYTGEAFAIIKRDHNGHVEEMHLLQQNECTPFLHPETSELFYKVGSNPFMVETIDYLVPNRNILHLRQHCIRNPLKGESDIAAAMMAIGTHVSLTSSQAAFFNNMSKPSGILSTDLNLNKEQITDLRAAFEAQSKKWGTGGLPILASGLRYQQMGLNSVDAQLIETQKMSNEEICMAFGVPAPLVGILDGATFSNTESLINLWLAVSLGALLENIERSLDVLFELPSNEHIDFDVSGLLRSNLETRINSYSKGVQSAIFSPNEIRKKEGLSAKDGGDDLYIQKQNVPISTISEVIAAELEKVNNPKPSVEVEPIQDDKSVEEELFIFKQYQK